MNLKDHLTKNQAVTKTKKFKVRGADIYMRQISMAENDRYFELFQSDRVAATVFLVKSFATNPDGSPLFTDEDDALISGSVDSALAPIIEKFWEWQNPKPKETTEGKPLTH